MGKTLDEIVAWSSDYLHGHHSTFNAGASWNILGRAPNEVQLDFSHWRLDLHIIGDMLRAAQSECTRDLRIYSGYVRSLMPAQLRQTSSV